MNHKGINPYDFSRNLNKSNSSQTPLQRLIGIIIISVIVFVFMFFFMPDIKYKVCACIVSPLLIGVSISAYFKEKKNDRTFSDKKADFLNGNYRHSVEWQDKYNDYRLNVGFEEITAPTMKAELLKRFRRGNLLFSWLLWLLSTAGCACAVVVAGGSEKILAAAGVVFFGFLMCSDLSIFFGLPVRKFYKRDLDFPKIERSFMRGKMLSYKDNGINYGTDYVVYYMKNKVYVINLRMVRNVTHKIVRVKKFEDSLYTGDEYRHYVVFDVRIPNSGKIVRSEIELNEFQAEMIVREYQTRNYYDNKTISVSEKYETDITV